MEMSRIMWDSLSSKKNPNSKVGNKAEIILDAFAGVWVHTT